MDFIQWPTLLGSTYIVPGMIVIALLLALLLLFSSRRRKKALKARMAPERAMVLPEEPEDAYQGRPAPGQEFGHGSSIVTQSVSMSAQAPAAAIPAPGPAVQTAPLAPPVYSAPAEAQPAAMPSSFQPAYAEEYGPASFDDEPAGFDMGTAERRSKRGRRGKQSKEDKPAQAATARPAVAIGLAGAVAASDPLTETIWDILNGWGEITLEDKKRIELFRPNRVVEALAAVQLPKTKSEDLKVRLDQLRRYSVDMQRAEQAAPAVAAAATATAAAAAAAVADTTMIAPAVVGAMPAMTAPPAVPFSAPVAPPSNGRSFFSDTQSTEPAPAYGAPKLGDKTAEWASPRPLWQSDADEEEFEILPAPAFDEIEMHTEMSAPQMVEPLRQPAAEPVRIMMGAPVPAQQPSVKSVPTVDDIFWNDETDEAYSRLGIRVETADQLLALPPGERMDMTAFLPPPELAAAFRATQDLDLKKAVIDTLEHIGSAASLNALGACFEDQDPGIQVYALAAADRLLGVL